MAPALPAGGGGMRLLEMCPAIQQEEGRWHGHQPGSVSMSCHGWRRWQPLLSLMRGGSCSSLSSAHGAGGATTLGGCLQQLEVMWEEEAVPCGRDISSMEEAQQVWRGRDERGLPEWHGCSQM